MINKSNEKVVIAGMVLLVVIILMNRFGLLKRSKLKDEVAKERQKKKIVDAELDKQPGFDPTYLDDNINRLSISSEQADEIASDIRKAVKGWGTDESSLFNAFRSLSSNADLAAVSLSYKVAYDRDMLTDVKGDLNRKEKVTLNGIIDGYD